MISQITTLNLKGPNFGLYISLSMAIDSSIYVLASNPKMKNVPSHSSFSVVYCYLDEGSLESWELNVLTW